MDELQKESLMRYARKLANELDECALPDRGITGEEVLDALVQGGLLSAEQVEAIYEYDEMTCL